MAATGLRLAYGGESVIDMPKMSIAPGSLTALAGPSGSGKSTLLYVLSGLLRPDEGAVLWQEEDITGFSESRRDRWRRVHAGFVFQNFHLIDELSPLDNVLAPLWFDRFSAASARPRAISLLKQLDVPLNRAHVSLLSRGQQQRVAIARALIRDPQIIFADEPTASLDAIAGAAVVEVLRQLAREEGRTIIAATHDPALKGVADSVVQLDHGRTLSMGERVA